MVFSNVIAVFEVVFKHFFKVLLGNELFELIFDLFFAFLVIVRGRRVFWDDIGLRGFCSWDLGAVEGFFGIVRGVLRWIIMICLVYG